MSLYPWLLTPHTHFIPACKTKPPCDPEDEVHLLRSWQGTNRPDRHRIVPVQWPISRLVRWERKNFLYCWRAFLFSSAPNTAGLSWFRSLPLVPSFASLSLEINASRHSLDTSVWTPTEHTKEANQNVMKEKPTEKQEAFGNRALGMLSRGTRNHKWWEERMQERREGAGRVRAQNSLCNVC